MNRTVVWKGDTSFGHFEVVDTVYDNRPARVLYSGNGQAAQSGIATDDKPELLFDYNQRFFELADGTAPKTVLIIGGGACTLATALLTSLPDVHVDVVEPDSGLTDLAYEFFNLPHDERLRLFHTDGLSYLAESTQCYDMVVLDAFVHTKIPSELTTRQAFTVYRAATNNRGLFCANIISHYYGPSGALLANMCTTATEEFELVDLFLASRGYSLWLPQNFVLAAQQRLDRDLQELTRGTSIALP